MSLTMFSAKAAGVGARENAVGASDRSSPTLRCTVHAREKAAVDKKQGGSALPAEAATSAAESSDARTRSGATREAAETARKGRASPVDRGCASDRLQTADRTTAMGRRCRPRHFT